MITSVTDLAEHFNCSRQTLYNWKAAGCPLDQGEDAITAWLAANRPAEESLVKQLQRAKLAEIEERTRAARLANDEQEGALVSLEAVRLETNELIGLIRHRLESIAAEIMNEFPADYKATAYQLVDHKIHMLLIEMSQFKLTAHQPQPEQPSPAA